MKLRLQFIHGIDLSGRPQDPVAAAHDRLFLFLLKLSSQNLFVTVLLLQNNSSAMLNRMCANGKLVIRYKSISWLLIAAILLVAFLPAHYHLHHLYNDDAFSSATRHAHAIDLHVLTEKTGQSHHDDETTIIAASPDGIVKKK